MKTIVILIITAIEYFLLISCLSNRNGENKFFFEKYENGSLKTFYEINNDKLNGLKIGFYKNGKTEYLEQYTNGIKEGLGIYLNNDGNIKQIINYKNNIPNGLVIEFYKNKKIKYIDNMKDTLFIGESYEFYPSQKIKKYRYFNPIGELVYIHEYNENGEGVKIDGSALVQLNSKDTLLNSSTQNIFLNFITVDPPFTDIKYIVSIIDTLKNITVYTKTIKNEVNFYIIVENLEAKEIKLETIFFDQKTNNVYKQNEYFVFERL